MGAKRKSYEELKQKETQRTTVGGSELNANETLDAKRIREKLKNTKYDPEKAIFAGELEDGTAVVLEEGKITGGFLHIQNKHQQQFTEDYGFEDDSELGDFLRTVFAKGNEYFSHEGTNDNGDYELIKEYKLDDDHYVAYTIADNGFIVTSFTMSQKSVARFNKEKLRKAGKG